MKGVEQRPCLYDAVVTPFERRTLRHWRRRLFADLRGDILELGIGTGLNIAAYNQAARITGIDPEPQLLARARARFGSRTVRLLAADAQDLPFADRTFDWVTSALVFCSIPDPRAALNEAARVLRPGGRIVQLEHTRTNHAAVDAALDLAAPAWKALAGGCHLNRDTPALLRAAGWRVLRHERDVYGLIRLLEAEPPAA